MARAREERPFDVTHRGVLSIAVPMTLAYLSTPLVGLTDTAVVGRLGDAVLLGGIAIGAILFDFLFTTFNFLRSGTTGLTAQAFGAGDAGEQRAVLLRFVAIAIVAGLAVVILQHPIMAVGLPLLGATGGVEDAARDYFLVRIYATPFVLLNYAILGWFLGLGRARTGLMLQVVLNGANVGLDILFVPVMGFGLEGAALATLIAEAVATFAGAAMVIRTFSRQTKPIGVALFDLAAFRIMFGVNRDIMIRSFSLLAAFAFFTREGARSGDIVLAANAVLLNFFLVGGYFLDGFANAAEQLSGRAIGARWLPAFDRTVRITFVWSLGLALILSAAFLLTGPAIIDGLTTNPAVREMARHYMIWAAMTPLAGAVAFQMDGIFIGATWSQDMRNMMLVSLAAFFAVWWVATPALGIHGLWLALLTFLGLRGVSLYWRLGTRRRLTFAETPVATTVRPA